MIIKQKDAKYNNFVPETPDISIVPRTLKCFQPGGFINRRANQFFLRMLDIFPTSDGSMAYYGVCNGVTWCGWHTVWSNCSFYI